MAHVRWMLALLVVADAVRNDETTIHSSEIDLLDERDRSGQEGAIIDAAVRLIRWGVEKGFANQFLPVPIQEFGKADCSKTQIGIIENHMANCTFDNIVIGNPAWDKLNGIADTAQKSKWTSDYMLKIRHVVIDVEFEGGFIFSSLTGVIIHQFKIMGVDALYETVPKLQQATDSWLPWNWYEDVPGPGSNAKLAQSLLKKNSDVDGAEAKLRPPDVPDGAAGTAMPDIKIPDSKEVQIKDIQICYITEGGWQLHSTFDVPTDGILKLVTLAQKFKNIMPASISNLLSAVVINGAAPSLLSLEKRACRGAGGM